MRVIVAIKKRPGINQAPKPPMSSGFVSGGTTDNPIQRDDEWLAAQQEIEARRRRKEEESRQADGKTLYEVLQNNKGDKQAALATPAAND